MLFRSAYGIGKNLFDLECTLKINFKNDIRALDHPFGDRFFGSAVSLIVHGSPFNKGVSLNHGIEFLLGHKKIVTPVFFLPSG